MSSESDQEHVIENNFYYDFLKLNKSLFIIGFKEDKLIT